MRILGGALFVAGMLATAYAVWASYEKKRPLDIVYGLAAPVALVVGLAGALLAFVPDFFR
jgi:hypothetical protein